MAVLEMHWYYNFLVRRPYLLILSLAVLSVACIIVSLAMSNLPDFSDPSLGFEARGTKIGKCLRAWHNLEEETRTGGSLAANPTELRRPSDILAETEFSFTSKRKNRNRNRNKNRKHKNKRKPKNQTQHKKPNAELTANTIVNPMQGVQHNYTDSEDNIERSPFEWNGDKGIFRDYEITNDSWTEQGNRSEHFEYGRNMTFVDEEDHREKIQTKKSTWRILKQSAQPPIWNNEHISIEGYFCDSPAKDYSHFVVKRIDTNTTETTLFDLNGLLAMCQLQDQITAVADYERYCMKEMLIDNCCRPWSLPNYAALFANKSSCFDLTKEDVNLLQNLLVGCFEYFHDLKLSNDCSEYKPCYAPSECVRHNIVYNILQYLTDYNFLKINDSNVFLNYAMIFVPVSHRPEILPLFHQWSKADLKNELVEVIAMDLGLENELFNESLLTDCWLVALGGVFVMTCMWLYTTSVFVTLMTFVAVLFSLGLSYFIYTLVFEMAFFPYMNLLAVVVIIGIGADDAFVFIKIWQCVLSERFSKTSTITTQTVSTVEHQYTETLQNLMALTLRHAAVSMCVTSVTTAGAFFASYTSSITAIKCFGIFAGTVVMTNLFFMVTWLPACVVIMERFSTYKMWTKLQAQQLLLMFNKSINRFCSFFESIVIDAVMKYPYLWIVLYSAVGIFSAVVVLYWPGLQLPEKSYFQLFDSEHPFEIYNSRFKNEFWFEKSISTYDNFKFPLRFVWGIEALDDGDYSNPYSHGNLHYDNNFNMSTKAAQLWLLTFCQHLRQQPFYQSTVGMLLPNCYIENFISLMNRMCFDGMDNSDRTPCCDVSKFPYEPHVFDLCLPLIISSLYVTPRQFFMPGVAGPKFYAPAQDSEEFLWNEDTDGNIRTNVHNNTPPPMVKALVIEFESNVPYTTVYHEVKLFVDSVEQWFSNELTTAPPEMQGGWFISELNFFDVQDTLVCGTLVAIVVAMLTSLVVLILSTFNVLISLYAVVTVTLTIFTTVAILILMGWKLNILESVAVSTSIGLAMDFSLHYGIHFRMSPTCERVAASQFALSRIIGPTIMAAVTTGFAGALMSFSNVLPYIQIGIFLVIVMVVSWLYATFFLMSLLKVAGPQYGFMQFKYPKLGKRPATNGNKYYERKQSQIIASEQLLTPSSSAVGDLINSETHELESLTSNTLIKTISGSECIHSMPVGETEEHALNNTGEKIVGVVVAAKKSEKENRKRHFASIAMNYQSPSTESATVELPIAACDGKNFYKA